MLNPFVGLKSTLLLASLLLIVAGGPAETQPVPERPPHHGENGFRNLDANFRRPSGWTRWNFVIRRLLAASIAPRTFEAPRIANDGAALRAGTVNPGVT